MLSKNELIAQLRGRLRTINERIIEREEVERATCNSDAAGDDLRCVLATGALMELRSEAAFWHKATNSSSIQQETNTMNDTYMDLTIAISESGVPYRGAWAASLVESNNLDISDESALSPLTGYGETPLEAAAHLLALAVAMQRRGR